MHIKTHLIKIFFFVLLFNCSSAQQIGGIKGPNIINRSKSTVFNYEYKARDLTPTAIDNSFNLRVEIEKPFIIERQVQIHVDDIYLYSNIEGMTIFKVVIDRAGKISSYRIIKSAGLGIDELLENVLIKMKFSPLYLMGESQNSTIEVKIEIVGKDRI